MDMTNNSIFLLTATLLGTALQQIPKFLKQRGRQRAASLTRMLVMGYWLALGIVLTVQGTTLLSSSDTLSGISYLALGLGITLSGLGQVLGRTWLKVAGVAIIAVGPVTAGIQFIQAGSGLNGLITLALGLGVLSSAIPGWGGALGRIMVGALLLGGAAMLLMEALVWSAPPPDPAVVAIGVGLVAFSLWAIVGGGLALFRAVRRPIEQQPTVT
jgi:hypothetical protein